MSTPGDAFVGVSLVAFPVQFLEITGDGRAFSPLFNICTCLHAESKARRYPEVFFFFLNLHQRAAFMIFLVRDERQNWTEREAERERERERERESSHLHVLLHWMQSPWQHGAPAAKSWEDGLVPTPMRMHTLAHASAHRQRC